MGLVSTLTSVAIRIGIVMATCKRASKIKRFDHFASPIPPRCKSVACQEEKQVEEDQKKWFTALSDHENMFVKESQVKKLIVARWILCILSIEYLTVSLLSLTAHTVQLTWANQCYLLPGVSSTRSDIHALTRNGHQRQQQRHQTCSASHFLFLTSWIIQLSPIV